MCAKIHHTIGTEKQLLKELWIRNIRLFHTSNEVFEFEPNRESMQKKCIEQKTKELDNKLEAHKRLLSEMYAERLAHTPIANAVSFKINLLHNSLLGPEPNTKYRWSNIKNFTIRREIENKEQAIPDIALKNRLELERYTSELAASTEYIIKTIHELEPIRLGMVGERMALSRLSDLPGSYHVINDYKKNFPRPLFRRETDEWITSMQADHVIIGPTGVFLIETKHWNANSIKSNHLRSPFEQIRRTNFALYIRLIQLLEWNAFSSRHLEREAIPVHNIVLMTNSRIGHDSQFVKVLGITELNEYIENRPIIFNDAEVEIIADMLSEDSETGY